MHLLHVTVVLQILFVNVQNYNLNKYLSQSAKPEPLFGPIELPKAPHWDATKKAIYFVDVYQSVVHRYIPETNTHTSATVGKEALAFIIPITDTEDKFIISYGPTVAVITWDGVSDRVQNLQQLAYIDNDVYRANEGKVAPSGTLFVGTHSHSLPEGGLKQQEAALYAYTKNGTFKKILDKVTVSNGMQWSEDGKRFYYIDSLAYTVESFSYDITNDTLGDRKLIYDFIKGGTPGVPDGMAIDNEGMIWVTSFGGYQILRLNPNTGAILEKIELDALQITSAAFVGPKCNDFYVTTGKYNISEEEQKKFPHSGWIYRASDFKVSGRPGVPFNLSRTLF